MHGAPRLLLFFFARNNCDRQTRTKRRTREKLTTRYQQGWPRRVLESSMISSETKKKAWSYCFGIAPSQRRKGSMISWLRLSCSLCMHIQCLDRSRPDNCQHRGKEHTHSMHQPKRLALKISSWERASPRFRMRRVSATVKPRFILPK